VYVRNDEVPKLLLTTSGIERHPIFGEGVISRGIVAHGNITDVMFVVTKA
jgi:hypothetical protein